MLLTRSIKRLFSSSSALRLLSCDRNSMRHSSMVASKRTFSWFIPSTAELTYTQVKQPIISPFTSPLTICVCTSSSKASLSLRTRSFSSSTSCSCFFQYSSSCLIWFCNELTWFSLVVICDLKSATSSWSWLLEKLNRLRRNLTTIAVQLHSYHFLSLLNFSLFDSSSLCWSLVASWLAWEWSTASRSLH